MGEGNGMERDAVRGRELERGWIRKGMVMGSGKGYDGIVSEAGKGKGK